MGIFYKVPLVGTHWGLREYLNVAASLLPNPGTDYQRSLASFIEEHFGTRPVLVNSGRTALEIALRRLARKSPADKRTILVPSLICPSVPEKIVKCGFYPSFYDVQEDLSPDWEAAIAAVGPDTAAVLYPYLYGKVADIDRLAEFCRLKSLPLIEDCAAAFLLTDHRGRPVGSYGEYVIFSFATGKTISAGSGGALLDRTGPFSEEPNLLPAEDGDIGRAKRFFITHYPLAWMSQLEGSLGAKDRTNPLADLTNEFRGMSALDVRLVNTQIVKWPDMFMRKKELLAQYASSLSAIPDLGLPQYTPGSYLNRLFVAFPRNIVDRTSADVRNSPLITYLRQRGVQVQIPYWPVHRRTEYDRFGRTGLARTNDLADRLVEVPTQIDLKQRQLEYVCRCLSDSLKYLRQAERN